MYFFLFAGLIRGLWCFMGLCILSIHGEPVSYDSQNMQEIPNDIPPDTTELTITRDYILNITTGAFQTLAALTYLEVSRSGVKYVHDGAFSGLDSLTNLELFDNEIRHLPDLSDIHDTITVLNLDSNPIAMDNIKRRLTGMTVLEELKLNSCGLSGLFSLPILINLKNLYANSNSITRLDSTLFIFLLNLEVFELKNNQLSHMDLAFPSSLTQLNYNNNKIPSTTRAVVNTLIGVRSLDLGNNDFSSLEDRTFATLDVLTSLSLQHLGLTQVPELSGVADTLTHLYLDNTLINITENLNGLDQLQRLDLHHCKLSGTLSLPTFPHMTELYLNNNQLTRLSPGIFDGYNSLSRLELQNNQIHILNIPTDFPTTLSHLDLSTNLIPLVPSEAFAIGNATSNLQQVLLFSCEVATIEKRAFNGLDHVYEVLMYDNAVTVLTTGYFLDLPGTTHMYLQQSSLTAIEVGTFRGQRSMVHLDLSINNLVTLQESTFQGLVSLTQLKLDYNDLSTLERGTFRELASLTTLYLDNNNLNALVNETFVGMGSLIYLYLQVNNIQLIEDGAFSGLYKLQELYLNDNSLVTFPEMADTAGSLVTLHIYNNPTMTYINASYLTNFNRLKTFIIYSCSLSGELDLPPLPALELLDVFSNQLTGINPKLFRGFSNLDYVDLRWNQFVELPLFEDSSGTFDPESNTTHVGFDAWFTLDLEYNEINAVPQASISRLTRGTINLGNNPINCSSMCWMFDCRTRVFLATNVNFPSCYGDPWQGMLWRSSDAVLLCPCKLARYLNSCPPSAACMRQWTGLALVQIMACRLFGANPLPEPLLTYCQLDP